MNSDCANWVGVSPSPPPTAMILPCPPVAAGTTRHLAYSAASRGEVELRQDQMEIAGDDCYCAPPRTEREAAMGRGRAEDTQLDKRQSQKKGNVIFSISALHIPSDPSRKGRNTPFKNDPIFGFPRDQDFHQLITTEGFPDSGCQVKSSSGI